MRVAARVRDHRYAQTFANEFTLRSKRDNGATTELEKIQKGFGDWFFYGFGYEDSLKIDPWYLIDLHAFRYHLGREGWKKDKTIKFEELKNGDGTFFKAFDVWSFPDEPPLLIACSAEPGSNG